MQKVVEQYFQVTYFDLDSRYPKLIYSFKKFFKLLKTKTESKEYFDQLIDSDFYAISDRHSLEEFEDILIQVIISK